jgi:hypothetical protein
VHWTEGGHKKVCKTVQNVVAHANNPKATDMQRPFEPKVCYGGACIICLETDPPPIYSGCACRGDAGLAHIECRVLAAAHRQQSTGKLNWWAECSTCSHMFVGSPAMSFGLAQELWRRLQRRVETGFRVTLHDSTHGKSFAVPIWPEEIPDRAFSAMILGNALINVGKPAEAETLCRETMAEFGRMGVDESDDKMTDLRRVIGAAFTSLQKHADAEVMYARCVSEYTKTFGPSYTRAIESTYMLASATGSQGKLAESARIFEEVAERSKRVLGPEHIITLGCQEGLSTVLFRLEKPDEAEAVYQQHSPVMKRVLGPDHKRVLRSVYTYGRAIARVGRYADAEVALVDNLERTQRVYGADHPIALHVAALLEDVRSALAETRKEKPIATPAASETPETETKTETEAETEAKGVTP